MSKRIKLTFLFPIPNHCESYRLVKVDTRIFLTYVDKKKRQFSELTCDLDPELYEIAELQSPFIFFDNYIYLYNN